VQTDPSLQVFGLDCTQDGTEEMKAGKSLHAFNLLYMCKAEKLSPGRNAF